jgi:hypothetical protein
MYYACHTESKKTKRSGRGKAIAVSADGRGGKDPNKTKSKNFGYLPIFSPEAVLQGKVAIFLTRYR